HPFAPACRLSVLRDWPREQKQSRSVPSQDPVPSRTSPVLGALTPINRSYPLGADGFPTDQPGAGTPRDGPGIDNGILCCAASEDSFEQCDPKQEFGNQVKTCPGTSPSPGNPFRMEIGGSRRRLTGANVAPLCTDVSTAGISPTTDEWLVNAAPSPGARGAQTPSLSNTPTVLAAELAVARSGRPSPLKSAAARA